MLLRAGLWFLAASIAAVGVTATLLPSTFYHRVPWVAMNPPYSEHLMRDYGAMNLALAVVITVAAVTVNTLLVRAALSALLVFAVAHLIFHATHLEHFSTGAAVAELATLSLAVALPGALLALTRARSPDGPRRSGVKRRGAGQRPGP
jgi:hypothetical protein